MIDMTLWNFKHMSRSIVRLKVIEYNKDSFYSLSSYTPNLGL